MLPGAACQKTNRWGVCAGAAAWPTALKAERLFFLFMLNNSKCIDFTGVRNAIVVYIASRTDLVAMCEVKVKLSSEAGLN